MKKTLLALALSAVAFGASAHPRDRVHYHTDEGVIYSRAFQPDVRVHFERDQYGNRVRVVTTTRCVSTRVNLRNNHLRCMRYDTDVERTVVGGGNRPVVEPVIYRSIERDENGRRWIVTTTYTCVDARWNPTRTAALCFDWESDVTREPVRRQPRSASMDLDGNGVVEPWERLVYRAFDEILDED